VWRGATVELDELKVPKGLRWVVDEIVDITDSVCLAVLDEDYADLARRAVAKLARKRPSPFVWWPPRHVGGRGGVRLGQANFLFDPASEPWVTADQLSKAFGVAKSTIGSKARRSVIFCGSVISRRSSSGPMWSRSPR
jgi:hypothetical protein